MQIRRKSMGISHCNIIATKVITNLYVTLPQAHVRKRSACPDALSGCDRLSCTCPPGLSVQDRLTGQCQGAARPGKSLANIMEIHRGVYPRLAVSHRRALSRPGQPVLDGQSRGRGSRHGRCRRAQDDTALGDCFVRRIPSSQ